MRNFKCSCRFLRGEISVATTIKLLLCSDEASSVTGNIKINFGNTCQHIFDYVTKAFLPFSIKQVNHPLKMRMCTMELYFPSGEKKKTPNPKITTTKKQNNAV